MTRTALVIGGTGPTGPGVVGGLLERGYDVSILHGGQHEVDLPGEVRHIHTDPHWPDTLAAGLGHREFDLVVAQRASRGHLAGARRAYRPADRCRRGARLARTSRRCPLGAARPARPAPR
ncbi:hypothetical protein ABT009_46625 [Streptomyces sp. NPDC002896]|uniref:hypothetical protein n=1 Tax=Streptomyces sp. NPDC002896 TaxID=3154438 RepID=UPI00332761CF